VRADRARREEEPVADLAVGQAVAGQSDDLAAAPQPFGVVEA
jgi:hypothetical protein